MDKVLTCNLCGSQSHVELRDKKNWSLSRCDNCNLVYLNPRPSQEELDKFYPKEYERHWILEQYLKGNGTYKKKLYNAIATAYSSSRSSFLKKLLCGPFRDHIGGLPGYIKNGYILDVGCADGFFIYLMKNLGWRTKGVEFSQSAAERARRHGLDVLRGDLFDARFQANSFDIVRFWHVLEHTPDPCKMLTEARRILKPGGELILGVPNVNSLTFKIFKDYNKWQDIWNLPVHFYFYSRKTLSELLAKSGFENFYIRNHSGGLMRLGLEKALHLSRLTRNNLANAGWSALFLFFDFLFGATPLADSLEARCKK